MSSESPRPATLSAGSGRSAILLVLISFLSLYFELTLIRWIPTQVRLLAYFTNFVLIAALLGLGVGMLLASRNWRLVVLFPVGLLALTALVLVLARRNLVLPLVTKDQFVWGYVYHLPAPGILAYIILIGFFLLMVGVFVFVGQEVGRALRAFEALKAYSLNIAGSLLGVLGFAFLNWLQSPPTVWFTLGSAVLLLYLLLYPHGRFRLLLSAAPLIAVVGLVLWDAHDVGAGVQTYWSPYYVVQLSPMRMAGQQIGYQIQVNKDSLQFPMDLSGRFHRIPYVASQEHVYNLPYAFIHPKRVLVLGAGSGNDVAAALRNAPQATVDAVEIDPVVAQLGRTRHPERPYSNPRVHLYVTDARSFLQQTTKTYDLIIFGKLDSHRVFSHMSSVRMDNYVYTQEDLRTVRRRLAPGGIISMGFVVHEQWIADRLFTLLHHVFGHAPLVYQSDANAFDTLFFIANRPLHPPPGAPIIDRQEFVHNVLRGNWNESWRYSSSQGFVTPTVFSDSSVVMTDDWPYLYMRDRGIPANYLLVLVLTVLVSVVLVWLTIPPIDFRSRWNWNFLFLGAGFALQETKGITDLALLFGSTWITNIVVISAILLVILLANLAVSTWSDIPLHWMYLALFAVLILNYLVPLSGLLGYAFPVQVAAAGVRVAGPLFFSGIIFARWFQRADSTSSALGANLMGAVVGGLAEYSSLALGLRNLYLLAVLFYALSFGLGLRPSFLGVRVGRRAPVGGKGLGTGD